MKVIIIGGGIGGLTTALMLHARGIDCELFEQSEGIRELGVGINTLPHAIKELQQLGLLERLDAVAIRTHELIYTNRFGQEIWREPRGIDAGYDVPQFSVHRGKLQGVIYQAVRSRLGESRLHTGHRLGGFAQDEGGVTAWFFDRNGSHRRTAHGDVLIGADGIHSYVRGTLYPNEGPARWNGSMLWRGALDWPKFLTGRSMVIAGGMAAKLADALGLLEQLAVDAAGVQHQGRGQPADPSADDNDLHKTRPSDATDRTSRRGIIGRRPGGLAIGSLSCG